VANEAVVGNQCRLEPGVLLSYGVKIANGMTIPENTRIARMGHAPAPGDAKVVGEGGEGYKFAHEENEDESDNESVASSGLIYNMAELVLSDASISTFSSEDRVDDNRSRSGSLGTSVSEDDDRDHFHPDAVASIYDGLRDGLSSDVVHLELVGLRMSANASEHQVRRAVVAAFMKRIQQLIETGPVGAGEAVKQVLTKYKGILDRIVFDRKSDGDKPDQVDLLLLIQKDLADRNKGETVLLFTAKELYDLEIVEEEAFEQWWEDERSSSTEALKGVRSRTQQFVEWLTSAEAGSDSEEDETDDE
jgi:translation initiation factor eIF-2B subunit epsilon